jgi:hypothetical protein
MYIRKVHLLGNELSIVGRARCPVEAKKESVTETKRDRSRNACRQDQQTGPADACGPSDTDTQASW